MIVYDSSGTLRYEWTENWAKTPDIPPSRENGRTHGVAQAKDGHVYIFHQSTPAVLVYGREGALVRSFSGDFPHAHGLTLVEEADGTEYLWLTDEASGRVAKVTLSGETVQTIARPDLPLYEAARYSPTWVAVNPANGDIWVTDGYGSGYIHRYDRDGVYLSSLSGEEPGAAGRFHCPHAVFFDTRSGKEPELYVADRGSRRVQVYDGAGRFLRAFGQDIFVHPCAFAAAGDRLYVPELFGRLAVLDGDDRLIGYVGENEPVSKDPGWPGASVPGWPNLPPEEIRAGAFNSPHGVATGADGSVWIVEWYSPGGRIVKLTPKDE